MRVVDALGTWCPVPVGLTARAVARLAPGERVEVWADDPLFAVDLPAWCHREGHELVALEPDGGRLRAVVRRRPAGGPASAPPGR